MAIYFFDSSAIVKRYVAEVGTMWTRTIADQAAGLLSRTRSALTMRSNSRRFPSW